MKQIKEFPFKTIIADSDLLLIQDAADNAYKKCTKAQLLAGTSSIDPAADPYFNNVVLLLPFNGSNNSTEFTDIKGKPINRLGSNLVISTVQSKFGGASAYFGGASYLDIPSTSDFDLNSGYFSIEGWFYFTNITNAPHIFQFGTSANNRINVLILNQKWQIFTTANNTTFNTNVAVNVGTWYFVQMIIGNGITRFYVDGTLLNQNNLALPIGDLRLHLGHQGYNTFSADYFIGYLDDFRLTKGVARNIVVPVSAFPNN